MKEQRNHSPTVIAVLCALMLLLVACGRGDATPSDTGNRPQAAQQVSNVAPVESARAVRTVRAETGTLQATKNSSVTIEPSQESRVASGTTGRVENILAREGQRVSAGDTIIQLDDDNVVLQLQNAELALESARINLQSSERASTESVSQLGAQAQTAQTNFSLAQRQFAEGQALLTAGGISQTDLQSLEAQFSQANSSLIQAQDGLARSQRASQEDLALLRVQINQAENQLAQAREALSETRIRAPFAGEVAEVLVEEGEFVAAGGAAFRLVSTDRQLGRFFVPPQDAQALLEQNQVVFRYQGLDYFAQIIRSSSAPNDQRLVELVAEIYQSDNPIPSGSVAQLAYTIDIGSGIKVPSAALSVEAGDNFIFVLENGTAVRKEITIISEGGGQVVVEGLNEDAQVISPVPADLRNGQRVCLVEQCEG